MKYHGNYCGPYWSAGVAQPSVVSDVPAVDDFDSTCKTHDAAYATNDDLYEADGAFYDANIGKGLKRSVAALLVKGQQLLLRSSRNKNINDSDNMKTMKNLRGSVPKRTTQPKRTQQLTTANNQSTRINVPAATGYQLGQFVPRTRRNGDVITVEGREFGASVNVVNSSNFGAAATVPLTPALFQSATLGAHAKCHEKYRFRRITAHYIPAVPTSSQGQIMLLSSKNINMPFINSAASSFLARGLTQSNAILTPIWQGAMTTIDCDDEWRNVDFVSENDIDDNIMEEVQVYGWSDATLNAGSILIDYVIEFKDPVYQPHSATIPDTLGPCTFVTAVDDTAVNNINDALILNVPEVTTYPDGTIFRMIFRQSASTLPTGPATWGTAFKVSTAYATSATTSNSTTANISLNEGSTLYGLIKSGQLVVSATLFSAKQPYGGTVVYQTATTAAGSYKFMLHLVGLGMTLPFTTQ